MCGLAGFMLTRPLAEGDLPSIAHRMGEAIHYRGPDDSGVWTLANSGVGLVHRRLSILDLSPEGHQPMSSASGRFIIVYNGEVYNYMKLRKQLLAEGCTFYGHSDTEVILAAIECWGLVAAVRHFAGMFAFALWDKQSQSLNLVRDRLGIKPLYYGWSSNGFVFGSELSALRAFPGFSATINRDALTLLMRHNYIPAPYSIFNGINKLEPGQIMTLSAADRQTPKIVSYWDASEVARRGVNNRLNGDENEIEDQLDVLLRQIISEHMISDVPLGAFLSGGVDSTMVVAQMQAQSGRPVKTFSIGFHEKGYNEAQHAKLIANHLRTEHTELYVSSEDALSTIPLLPTIYSEPFADSSQIPTFLVSKLARQQVTVSLSGDGGDELFGGYDRYFQGDRIWRKVIRIPEPVGPLASCFLRTFSNLVRDRKFGLSDARISWLLGVASAENSMRKMSRVLESTSLAALYLQLVSHWTSPCDVVVGGSEPPTAFSDFSNIAGLQEVREQMMLIDMISYLPDDILTKVDRASMAVSLEARVPLLDHRLAEFAWQLPLNMKIRDDQGKWILRRVLGRYVPCELMNRPKMGFRLPIEYWLRHQLKDWAENLLDEAKLKNQGYFNAQLIRQKWQEYLAGQDRWYPHLWNVLMFQAWIEIN